MRQGFAPFPRLECSDGITAHCSLDLLGSSDPASLASRVVETAGMIHDTRLTLVLSVEMEFHHVAQAGFELLGSSDLPTLAS